jgi:predicted NBD/HSP70 family sugar kinase
LGAAPGGGGTGSFGGRGVASGSTGFVVGGGVATAGDLLLEPARASFRAHAAPAFRDVQIAGSSFEGWEGMVGAASLALDPLVRQHGPG